jgi:hypothetical protein
MSTFTQSHRRKTWKAAMWKGVVISTSYQTSRKPTLVKKLEIILTLNSKYLYIGTQTEIRTHKFTHIQIFVE